MGVKVREKVKGSGVWWVFVHQKGDRTSLRVGSKAAAKKAAREIEARLILGQPIRTKEKRAPTLERYYERFRDSYMETALRPSTRDSYETSFRVHILPELGKLRVDELDRVKMEEFVSGLVKKRIHQQKTTSDSGKKKRTLSKNTIRLIIAALSVLVNDAIEKGVLRENPLKGISKFYRQAPSRHQEIEPLTEEETALFLKAAAKHASKYFPLFLASVHTGMRSGELAGLQWRDIDWKGAFIWVRRQFVRGREQPLKTRNGRRKVDLSDELLSELKMLKKHRQTEYLKDGKNSIPDWIFCSEEGTPIDMYNFKRRHFKRILRKAGLREIRFHDLRYVLSPIMFLVSTSGFLYSSLVFCKG